MKEYMKPSVTELAIKAGKQVVPLGAGLALAGGYMLGKAIKDSRSNELPLDHLEPVLLNVSVDLA